MQINQEGLELVKFFEGFRERPYKCSAGVWTQGYGHTSNIKENSPVITEEQAEMWLRQDLRQAETAVHELIDVPLNINQFSALVSFTFNVGRGNLKTSTLRKLLNKGEFLEIPEQLCRWKKAGGKVLAGLVKRRLAEAQLFMKG